MLVFDKSEIRKSLTIENIYDLLNDWGGDPQYTSFGVVSATICHNLPGIGSRKLYYYTNTDLFHCYTGCEDPSFDIFELCTKVMKIQFDKEFDLNDAVMWIARRFGLSGSYQEDEDEKLEDWKIFSKYSHIKELEVKENHVILNEYNPNILSKFNYKVKLQPWLDEEISQLVIDNAHIGFYPGDNAITIPHYDINNRFIGLRGRTMGQEEAENRGKYYPLRVNKLLYNHPLGMNLYGLNWSKRAIGIIKKAIIFESEKSVLKYASYFGWNNNISVACCGSAVSVYQIQELLDCGAEEIIIAFDRQFQEINDKEFKHLKNNLLKIRSKFKNDVIISFIFDKNMLTSYKASPIDEGPEKFLQLFKERIVL